MDRWTHVAGTWDGQWLRLFVDGAQEPTPRRLPPARFAYPGVYETWLGRSRTAGNSFRGEIDEIRIWSEARGEGRGNVRVARRPTACRAAGMVAVPGERLRTTRARRITGRFSPRPSFAATDGAFCALCRGGYGRRR